MSYTLLRLVRPLGLLQPRAAREQRRLRGGGLAPRPSARTARRRPRREALNRLQRACDVPIAAVVHKRAQLLRRRGRKLEREEL